MRGYRNQLEFDLAEWQERGWVTPENAKAIRDNVAARRSGPGLAPILAILGAVLLGFAAMTFVAANWQDLSKLARLTLLFGSMWASYGIAGFLRKIHLDAFSHAAILTGIGIFGASIMLIAQMYHMDGNPADAVFTWGLGAWLAGLLTRSNPAIAAATVILGFWTGLETITADAPHWTYLLVWLGLAATMIWHNWRSGLHLAAVSLTAWVIMLGFVLDGHFSHWFVIITGLIIAALAIAADRLDFTAPVPALEGFASSATAYGLIISFAGLFALQFFVHTTSEELVLLAAITLAFMMAIIFYGWHNGNRTLAWLAYAGFSIELLALYFHTLGSLLGTSLFFFIAGLLVIALSSLAWWMHKHQAPPEETM